MVRTRSQKDQLITEIQQVFAEANSFFLVSLTGLKSNEINDLRAVLRQRGAHMRVVKNRLARRAGAEGPLSKLDAWFKGPTAVVFHPEEPVTTAKGLVDFAKDHPGLKIKAGMIDRAEAVAGEGIKAVAELPTLEQARGMLLGLMQAPATRLLRLINTPATQLAYVMKQRGDAAPASAEEN